MSRVGPRRRLSDPHRLELAKNAAARLLRHHPHDFTAARIAAAVGQSTAWVYDYMGHPAFIRRMLVRRHFGLLLKASREMMGVLPGKAWPQPWGAVICHIWGAGAGPWAAVHHPAMIASARMLPGVEWVAWLESVERLAVAVVAGCDPSGVRQDPVYIRASIDAAIGIMVQAAHRGDWRPAVQREAALLASQAILTHK